MWKKSFTAFIALIALQLIVAAQPVCKDSLPLSLLLNPSFEDHGNCNQAWQGEGGLIDGSSSAVDIPVPYWHPENTYQFIRYYSYDCRRTIGSVFDLDYNDLMTGFPGVPLPLPSGNGLISVEQNNLGQNGNLPEKQTNKKYITTCLTSPLQAGKTYGFAFDLGFGRFNSNFNDITGFWAAASPFSIGIFGRTDCPAFPLNRPVDSAAGCLADRPGWIALGKVTLRGKSEWVRGYIEFTAPANITSIGVGPSCEYNENIKDTFALYYMDNFVLSEREKFAFASITAQSGDACYGHYVLQAPLYSDANYQWYKEGRIISNAVGQTYIVPDEPASAGNYSVNISLPGDCFTSLPFAVTFSPVRNLTLGNNSIVCDSGTLTLNATLPGVNNYHWKNGSTDPVFTANTSGDYSVTAIDDNGCSKTASVNLSFINCSNCKLYFPGAFTPNHDGLNDIFRPKTLCNNLPLLKYHLIIYNRWGQPVFTSSDPTAGWDGNFHNTPAPQSVYVYIAEYSFSPNKTIRTTSTLLLTR
jgi:gliding motility-associated-like protein